MTTATPTLASPIDAMYLVHKALRAEAGRVKRAVDALETGGSFKPFRLPLYRWALALGYHADIEDRYVTACLLDAPPARDNEAGHRRVMDMLENLQAYLHEELGRTIVIARTQRHLWGKVMAVCLAQDDLLDEEEAYVLPLIRQRISKAQQVEMVRRLLLDQEAAEETWFLDWVAQDLTAMERRWLADLEACFATACTRTAESGSSCCTKRTDRTANVNTGTTGDMPSTSTRLDTPIDVMYLIHQALRAEVARVEQLVEQLEVGSSLQPVQQAFNRWSAALGYHAEAEDQHMTSLLPGAALARDNEAAHQRLAEMLADLQTALHAAGQQAVTARTQRHLLGQVVALQIAQDDHLEEEEELVLPLLRERLSTPQQSEIARHLLGDPGAQDAPWVRDWVVQHVTAMEQQWLVSVGRGFPLEVRR